MAFNRASMVSSRAAATGIGAAVVLHGVLLSGARLLPASSAGPQGTGGIRGGSLTEIETRIPRFSVARREQQIPKPKRIKLQAGAASREKPLRSQPLRSFPMRSHSRLRVALNPTRHLHSVAPVAAPQHKLLQHKLLQTTRFQISSHRAPLSHPIPKSGGRRKIASAAFSDARKTASSTTPGNLPSPRKFAQRTRVKDSFRRAFVPLATLGASARRVSSREDETAGRHAVQNTTARHSDEVVRRRPLSFREPAEAPHEAEITSWPSTSDATKSAQGSEVARRDASARRRLDDAHDNAAFRPRIRREARRDSKGLRNDGTSSRALNATIDEAGGNASRAFSRGRKDRRAYRYGKTPSGASFIGDGTSGNHAVDGETLARGDANPAAHEFRTDAETFISSRQQNGAPSSGGKQDDLSNPEGSNLTGTTAQNRTTPNPVSTENGVSGSSSQTGDPHGATEHGATPVRQSPPGESQSGVQDKQSKHYRPTGRTDRNRQESQQNMETAQRDANKSDANKSDVVPRVKARLLSEPVPHYPEEARRLGQEGVVLLRLKISASGEVQSVVVARSSGHELLDEAAVQAVRKCRAAAIESSIRVPVRFRLE